MSFRQNTASTQAWKNWMESYRDELLMCDVPLMVLENERHWTYFLEHGYYTPPGFAEPIVNIDRMDRNKLERLREILGGDDRYRSCAISPGF